ncbi:hypothetical protein KBY65_06990 [Cyanobium sp. Alchichica 3B3-8F6]|uniref:hypothetical protein n=1 Tax=Synechococcus sp. 8F6 TaxID=2025606 RepID=UPI00117BFD29|nr:hypothetical protein [Synechococcus sp. 8F6]MCP9882222.1 hypothetical protein [Cyanobium sp. Alchichica 3B3-8F6]
MAHAQVAAPAPARPRSHWQVPLVVGVCFGFGYGITHRLLALQLPSLVRLGQGFEMRPFPGITLESLRLRFGADNQEIRGDLDLLELENKPTADPPAAKPEDQPTPDPGAGLREAPLDPAPLPMPRPTAPVPRLEAPPPPQLPSADLPQFSPEAGPR